MNPRFSLGRIVATPAVIALGIDLSKYVFRHHCGDWGDLDRADKLANEDALLQGYRILSVYEIPEGERLYVVTEADRSSTCLMLAAEY